MFDKLKQLKQMQSILTKEEVQEEVNGVKIKINGKMEILEIVLNPDLDLDEQGNSIKKCFNQAIRKIQFNLASQMSQLKAGL